MTTRFKHFLSVFTISIFIIFALASTSSKQIALTTESKEVPPKFNTFKDTLLVIARSDDRIYDKLLKKNFDENYTGNYKIIKINEVGNYSTDKYRYIFDRILSRYSKTSTTTFAPSGGGNIKNGSSHTISNTTSYITPDRFFITDRKINKDYVSKSFGNYPMLMKGYIMALEIERQR